MSGIKHWFLLQSLQGGHSKVAVLIKQFCCGLGDVNYTMLSKKADWRLSQWELQWKPQVSDKNHQDGKRVSTHTHQVQLLSKISFLFSKYQQVSPNSSTWE